MSTRTSELIEQALREWDDYAAIDDEKRFECVTACVERHGIPKAQAAQTQPEASGRWAALHRR
ncbi:MAG: hypothetical protein ACXW2I_18620 [Burkholderiales bacterium]